LLLFSLLALLALHGCKEEGQGKEQGGQKAAAAPAAGRAAMKFPVEVRPVQAEKVEFVVNAVGQVEAFERVQVTAKVAGAVEKVRFVEGQPVKKGDPLVEIEPYRFQLAVQSARAALEKAQASQAEAASAAARREEVERTNPGLIRGEELEAVRTRALTAAAELSQAKAALAQAELNLRDAYVRAPESGSIQTRTVQTGQYVQPGTLVATLLRRDPLLLRFSVPEGDAAQLSAGMAVRFRVRAGQEHTARIRAVAESADESTRMVAVVAEVDDPAKDQLRAGSFAEVTVPVGAHEAPVIPQTAVRPSERGFLAFVVQGDQARERILTLGMRTPGGDVEVRAGLQTGEQLVVRGAEALKDGSAVRVEGAGGGGGRPAARTDGGPAARPAAGGAP
jgi:multidrug efflux system membrane fusion protein